MAADAGETVRRPPRIRSRLGNGSKAFSKADGRSAGARLLRDREHELAEPFGGLTALSSVERLRVQSAAALATRLEAVRSGIANGDAGVSDEDLARLTNSLSRELARLEQLGAAKRKASTGTGADALRRYLAEKAEAAA